MADSEANPPAEEVPAENDDAPPAEAPAGDDVPGSDVPPSVERSGHSFMSGFPLRDSTVLIELQEADRRAGETAKLIAELRQSILEYAQKEQLSDEDAVILQQKQNELMEKLSEFEEITKTVQRLVGLTQVSSSKLEIVAGGVTPVPSRRRRPIPSTKFSPALSTGPESILPRVIVCASIGGDNQVPKVILVDQAEDREGYGAEFAGADLERPLLSGRQTQQPQCVGGGGPGGDIQRMAQGGGCYPGQMGNYPQWGAQQGAGACGGADDGIGRLKEDLEDLENTWKHVLYTHRLLKMQIETGAAPPLYPAKPLCRRTMGGAPVCKMAIYKEMGLPFPYKCCQDVDDSEEEKDKDDNSEGSGEEEGEEGSKKSGIRLLGPTPPPPGGPFCVFDLERQLQELRAQFNTINELCPTKIEELPFKEKRAWALKEAQLVKDMIDFQTRANYAKKFGCCRPK